MASTATVRAQSLEALRQQLDDYAEIEPESQERNELLRNSHPAFANADAYQQLRYPNDPGTVNVPAGGERQREREARGDDGGLLDTRGFMSAGRGSGEGSDQSAEKMEALRVKREKAELRAMRGIERTREAIEKSDAPVGVRLDRLNELGQIQRKLEYSRAASVSVGHANAMAERARVAGLI